MLGAQRVEARLLLREPFDRLGRLDRRRRRARPPPTSAAATSGERAFAIRSASSRRYVSSFASGASPAAKIESGSCASLKIGASSSGVASSSRASRRSGSDASSTRSESSCAICAPRSPCAAAAAIGWRAAPAALSDASSVVESGKSWSRGGKFRAAVGGAESGGSRIAVARESAASATATKVDRLVDMISQLVEVAISHVAWSPRLLAALRRVLLAQMLAALFAASTSELSTDPRRWSVADAAAWVRSLGFAEHAGARN